MKHYQEFQKRQVQSLLELREAQADTESKWRLEHLRQVRGACGGEGEPPPGQTRHPPVSPLATCVHRLSSGSGRLSWMHTQPS